MSPIPPSIVAGVGKSRAVDEADAVDLRGRADENFRETFRILARGAAVGAAAQIDGACLIATGVPVPLFNPAFLTQTVDLPRLVDEARAFYRERGIDWALVVPEPLAEVSNKMLYRAGLRESQTMPVLARETGPDRNWPAVRTELAIRVATDGRTVADHRALLDSAFGIPDRLSRMVLAGVPSDDRLRLYVAYDTEGAPVGSAALCVAAGVAGIYNVASDPARRRRGIATALMQAVLADARERGLGMAILQSSRVGLPLYARLGFTPLSTYVIYVDR